MNRPPPLIRALRASSQASLAAGASRVVTWADAPPGCVQVAGGSAIVMGVSLMFGVSILEWIKIHVCITLVGHIFYISPLILKNR